jgi:lysophospholipase L1-like esterase
VAAETRAGPGLRANLALALVSLAVLGLVAEGVARCAWHRSVSRSLPERPEEWRGLPEIRGLFELGRPNVRGIAGGVLFETNSAGFRGPERSLEKPDGVFRIVVIGDSVTMGMGVLEEKTYAARLEPLLDARIPDREVQVLNLGLSGLNTRWIVHRLEQRGLRYDPDLVVYGYTLNDIEGAAYRRSARAGFSQPASFWPSPLYLWRYLGPRLNSFRELLWAPRGSYSFELDDNYFRNQEAWQTLLDGFDRLAEITRERGLCTAVLVHTRLYSLGFLHPYRRHYEAVTEATRERGFYAFQSWPRHRGGISTELWIGPFDPHPNAEGHALLLEALLEGLDTLPDSCWKGSSPS